MAVPTHFRFSFRGVFSGTPEEWSFGLHYSRVNEGEADAGFDDIDDSAVTAAFEAFIGGGGSGAFGPNVKATEWRAYVIGTDGRMEGNPLHVDIEADNAHGVGSLKLPPQCSTVVTFVAANRGPARFGRIYLPATAVTLQTDLRLSDGDAGEIREATTTFVKAVADAIDLEALTQSALLNISELPAGTGTSQEVDHLEVGRVVDTLRSRRRSMLEERNIGGHIDW